MGEKGETTGEKEDDKCRVSEWLVRIWKMKIGKMKSSSMLVYSIEFCSFLFLQRAKPSNLTSKNKEVVGVALSPIDHVVMNHQN
jgi:hypothetical protein